MMRVTIRGIVVSLFLFLINRNDGFIRKRVKKYSTRFYFIMVAQVL
jgi:hypothetical protein